MTDNLIKNIVLVPAAGIGSRFNFEKPKQYFKVNGKSILEHTIESLAVSFKIDLICINLNPSDKFFNLSNINKNIITIVQAEYIVEKREPNSKCPLIIIKNGGKTRAKTVKNALEYLISNKHLGNEDWVLVHDAVRCNLALNDLENLINQISGYRAGGLLATPVVNTLKKVKDKKIMNTIDRNSLWQAQTPQMFKMSILKKALEVENIDLFTDESSLVEGLGYNPLIVEGDIRNIKITTMEDIELIKVFLKERFHGI